MICSTTPGSHFQICLAVLIYYLSIEEDMVFDFHLYICQFYFILFIIFKDTTSMVTAPFFFFKRALANVAA